MRTNGNRWMVAAALAGAAALGAVAALATADDTGLGGTPALTAERAAQLDAIRQRLEERVAPIRRELEATRMELEAELTRPQPDLDRVRKLRRTIRTLEERMDDAWLEASAEARKVLPEDLASGPAAARLLRGWGHDWHGGWFCPWDHGAAATGSWWGCPWDRDMAMHGPGRWSRTWRSMTGWVRGCW